MKDKNFDIQIELKNLPDKAGVYLMYKSNGEVIYVGKAKNLKNRVRQYFQDTYNKTSKIKQMISNISYFEYIVVDNELESLILESNLIKEYRPRYNTLLKDDKHYPYIKLTTDEEFPRVFMVHNKAKDKALYFGPYISSNVVKEILNFIKNNYKIRLCKYNINSTKKIKINSCLYYHLNMCLAPCKNECNIEYKNQVSEIKDLLNGNTNKLIENIKQKMKHFSDNYEFEKASIERDKIFALEKMSEKQKISSRDIYDKDILGLYKKGDIAIIQIFEVRDGNIIDRNVNILNIDENDTDSEIISSFLKQYYNESFFLPKEVWLPCNIDEIELFDKWVKRDKKKCKIVIPKKGEKDKLVKLASLNAKIQYDQKVAKYIREKKELDIVYDTLIKITGLDNIKRIEAYDISNTSGVLNVASMVVWEGNGFKKKDYRKFRLKSVDGPDDYASMKEVITRRIERFLNDDSKFNTLPSIFFIDGGKGQINSVLSVLDNYKIDIPVIGMVKDDNHNTRGLIYNDVLIDLKDFKELFKFVSKIQDETHRFAIEYHKTLRTKEMISCIKEKTQKE